MQIYVRGSGQRGNHGCSGYCIVEGTVNPATDGVHDYVVSGIIVDISTCPVCGEPFGRIGDVVEWGVWYDPEYYGHDDYQL